MDNIERQSTFDGLKPILNQNAITDILISRVSESNTRSISRILERIGRIQSEDLSSSDVVGRVKQLNTITDYLSDTGGIATDLSSLADYVIDPGAEVERLEPWPDDRLEGLTDTYGLRLPNADLATKFFSTANEIFSDEDGTMEVACPDGSVYVFEHITAGAEGRSFRVYRRILSDDQITATDVLMLQVLSDISHRKDLLVESLTDDAQQGANAIVGLCSQMSSVRTVSDFVRDAISLCQVKGSITYSNLSELARKYGNIEAIQAFMRSIIGVDELSISVLCDAVIRFIKSNSGDVDDGIWKPYATPNFCSNVFAAIGSMLSDVVLSTLPLVLMAVSKVAGALAFFASSVISAVMSKIPSTSAVILRQSETPTWNVPLHPAVSGVPLDYTTAKYLGKVFDEMPVASFPLCGPSLPNETLGSKAIVGYLLMWPDQVDADPEGNPVVRTVSIQTILAAVSNPNITSADFLYRPWRLEYQLKREIGSLNTTFQWMKLCYGPSPSTCPEYKSSNYLADYADEDRAKLGLLNAIGSIFSMLASRHDYTSHSWYYDQNFRYFDIYDPDEIWNANLWGGNTHWLSAFRDMFDEKHPEIFAKITLADGESLDQFDVVEYKYRIWCGFVASILQRIIDDGPLPSWSEIYTYILTPMWNPAHHYFGWGNFWDNLLDVDVLGRTGGLPYLFNWSIASMGVDSVPNSELYEATGVFTPGALDTITPSVSFPEASTASYIAAAMAVFAVGAVAAYAGHKAKVALQSRANAKIAFREAEFERAKANMLANPRSKEARRAFYKANKRLSRSWNRASAVGLSAYNGFSTASNSTIFSSPSTTSLPSLISDYIADPADKSLSNEDILAYLCSMISGESAE